MVPRRGAGNGMGTRLRLRGVCMASLEKRGDTYRAKFRYGGRQFSCSLKTGELKDAQSLLGRLEENLALLERGRLELPPGADLGLFLLSDGKLNRKPVVERLVTV